MSFLSSYSYSLDCSLQHQRFRESGEADFLLVLVFIPPPLGPEDSDKTATL